MYVNLHLTLALSHPYLFSHWPILQCQPASRPGLLSRFGVLARPWRLLRVHDGRCQGDGGPPHGAGRGVCWLGVCRLVVVRLVFVVCVCLALVCV